MALFELLHLDPTVPIHTPFQLVAISVPYLIFGVLGIYGLRQAGKAQEPAGEPGQWEAWPTHTGLQMRRRAANRPWEYRPATPAEQADYVQAEAW